MATLRGRSDRVAGGVLVLRIAYGLALPVKPTSISKRWLGEGVMATVAAREEIRPVSAAATLAIGGGAALISAGIARAADR